MEKRTRAKIAIAGLIIAGIILVLLARRSTSPLGRVSAKLTSIEVSLESASIPQGTSAQLHALGIYSDQTHRDITREVTWNSSRSFVATISVANVGKPAGALVKAFGHAPGSTTLSASLEGVTGTAPIEVTGAILRSITVMPAAASVVKGMTTKLSATGIYSDGSTHDVTDTANWESSSPTAICTSTGDERGLVYGADVGEAAISALLQKVKGTITVTVTATKLIGITLRPDAPSVAVGQQVTLTATGEYADGTTRDLTREAEWSASNPAAVAVNDSGLAVGVGEGIATITAAVDAISATAALHVENAALAQLSVVPRDSSAQVGETIEFRAIGVLSDGAEQDLTSLVTWRSTNQTVAKIGNGPDESGKSVVLRPGNTTISAALANVSGDTTLTAR